MPFIARPAAGQIIDPAWGTLVADAVIMRFTTAAQRASQLTAPATNQLTQLDSRPGVVQYWSGSAWVDAAPLTQAGRFAGSTNANGQVAITYPVAFAALPIAVATIEGPGTTAAYTIYIHGTFSTATQAVFTVYLGNTPYLNQAIFFHWIAFGSRVAPA